MVSSVLIPINKPMEGKYGFHFCKVHCAFTIGFTVIPEKRNMASPVQMI
jgi:hypothetical protein